MNSCLKFNIKIELVGIRKDFVLKNRWREKSKLHYYIKILYCFKNSIEHSLRRLFDFHPEGRDKNKLLSRYQFRGRK